LRTMDPEALTRLNVGQNLDDLANLDPRGYGVCRILYDAARAREGGPLSMRAAALLASSLKAGDLVYILTGFVLIPYEKAEMDGIVSSMLLARSLVKASGAKPVIVCPEDCLPAVRNMAPILGLELCESAPAMLSIPNAITAFAFTKDPVAAPAQAELLIAQGLPAFVVSIEAPGANAKGVYHNAKGLDVTRHQAKSDILFSKLRSLGVPSVSIGDLGNEIGMGAIGEHLNRYIPGARPGSCACGCGGGIAAATQADAIVTATVSDWGCYGMIAALAFLKDDLEILQSGELEAEAIKTASSSGMIDMSGALIPSVDGCDLRMNVLIVELMRDCVAQALKLRKQNDYWFDGVLELGFFQGKADA
jgi:hypothetical protein